MHKLILYRLLTMCLLVSLLGSSVLPAAASGPIDRPERQVAAVEANPSLPEGTPSYLPLISNNTGDPATATATPTATPTATATPTETTSVLPSDPAAVAPELDMSASTSLHEAIQFLYTGDNPIQTGVDPETIEARRVAVLRGKVMDRENQPLPGVTITVLDHPEYGQTLSRADGMFDLAVNGGGPLVLDYQKEGYLPVQRQVQTPWQDYTVTEDVVMIPYDPQVTAIDLTGGDQIQVARGSVVTDEDGSRQSTLFFPPGVQATMVFPEGNAVASSTLATANVRATEYTVGANGPAAMPAGLPPQVGYTYAVELSVDEAVAAGAVDVEFSQPLINYVENFLDFPVGAVVPSGYYDRDQGRWIASKNGRVVEILSVTNGQAVLDTDGDGAPDDGGLLGITEAEQAKLAQLYQPGQSLWRVPVRHFTPWDYNWPYGPPPGAEGPDLSSPFDPDPDDSCQQGGSVIGCEAQTLGEAVGIAGTPFTLHYTSRRTSGYTTTHALDIVLSGDSLPPVTSIDLRVSVAGTHYYRSFPPQPNLTHTFVWDGKDVYSRTVQGVEPATIQVCYIYRLMFMASRSDFESSFGGLGDSEVGAGGRGASFVALCQQWTGLLGHWDARGQHLGGWTLDVHHALDRSTYDPAQVTLYRGDASRRRMADAAIATVAGTGATTVSDDNGDGGSATEAAFGLPVAIDIGPDGSLYIADDAADRIRRVDPEGIISTVAGTGEVGYSGDGGPATQAKIHPIDVAVGADGSLYIAEGHQRVRRVGPDGIITTVAGTGQLGTGGDGGPATEAQLAGPRAIAVGPDGTLYIADNNSNISSHRIRRVGPDGIITTFAGSESGGGFSGDGGPATEAKLNSPRDVALGPDGALFIIDSGNHRIRRVGPDGIITTVAGTGVVGNRGEGDGGPATEANLGSVWGIATGPDGSLYLAERGSNRIRRVDPDGIITTVAGSGTRGYSGDGGLATQAKLDQPTGVVLGPDGGLYIADLINRRIRRVARPLAQVIAGNETVASEDGRLLYIFNSSGRHLRTLHALTNATLYEFGYEGDGRLISITDGDGNVTLIERDGQGQPTAIVAPFGQRTQLSVNTQGYLSSITNPANESAHFTYTDDGLLTSMTDPRNHSWTYSYDDEGRLVADEDPIGSAKTLVRNDTDRSDGDAGYTVGYTVTVSTVLSRTTAYAVEHLPSGAQRRTVTAPDGTQAVSVLETDGSSTLTRADGARLTVVEGPDPRFDTVAPILAEQTSTTPAGLRTTTSADREIELADPNDLLSPVTLTDTLRINNRPFTSVYDVAARTFTGTSPTGRQDYGIIDELGRVVEEQVPGLAPVYYTYDQHGRLETVTTGSGAGARITRFAYNSDGYLTSVTDPLNRTLAFQRDAVGRVILQTLPGQRTIAYTYDDNGNLTGLTPPGQPVHTYAYNEIDQETSYTAPDVGGGGHQTHYHYNADHQLVRTVQPDSQTAHLSYDETGRLASVAIPQGQINYGYDPATGNVNRIAALDSVTLTFAFDGGLPTTTIYSGTVAGRVERHYDNNLWITSLAVNGNTVPYGYDDDGLLVQAGSLSLTRNPQNGLLTGTSVGSVADSLTYNSFGEITHYTATHQGAALLAVDYTRDQLGRIIEKTETIAGESHTYSYGYDVAGRLVEVKKDGAVIASYTYDANGNRLTVTDADGATSTSYDAQDRLLSYGAATYTYTANGELQRKTAGSQTTTYDYDILGNLRDVSLPDGTQIEYVIDGLGRRIGKKVDGVLIRGFLYQSELNPIAELDGNDNVVSRFVYASRPHVPDYMLKDGRTYRLIADHLGSVRLVIDIATGEIAQRLDYDAWGNVLQDTNPGFQPFGFAGGLYDPDTGLVRFGARDYDPETGRWTAKDPIGFTGGDTNFYAYVGSEPVNEIDPSGLQEQQETYDLFDVPNLTPDSPLNLFDVPNPPPVSSLNGLQGLTDLFEDIKDLYEQIKPFAPPYFIPLREPLPIVGPIVGNVDGLRLECVPNWSQPERSKLRISLEGVLPDQVGGLSIDSSLSIEASPDGTVGAGITIGF